MRYLYGDATESPLDRNYIELLRDALDFSAAMLTSCDLVLKYEKRAMERERNAADDLQQLDQVAQKFVTLIEDCKRMNGSALTTQCIESIRALCTAELKRAENSVKSSLVDDVKNIKKAIVRERADNTKRLEQYLVRQDLPSAIQSVDLLASGSHYIAFLSGKSTIGLSYILDLEIPSNHLMAELLRVERLMPDLTIKVPEKSGWVRKSVKLRAHRLAKEYLLELSHSGGRTQLKLRSGAQDAETGFDVVVVPSAQKVAVTRVAKNAGHEPFEPLPEDSEQLLTLHTHLYNALKDLEKSRRGLREAKLDGTPFGDHPDPRLLVDRLVEHMAPFVREISRRSMSKTELVLKRVLADDRREEVFCSKADLLDKFAGLSPQMRKVFAPLELGDVDRLGNIEPDRDEVPLPKLSSVPVPSTNRPAAPRDEDDEQTGVHDSSQPAGRRAPSSQPSPLVRGAPATQRLGDPRSTLPGTGTPVPPPYVAQPPFGPAPSAMPPRAPLPSEQTRVVMPTPRPRFVPRTPTPPPPSRPAPPRRGMVKDDTTVEVKIEETED